MEKVRFDSRIWQVLPDGIWLLQRLVESPDNAFSNYFVISFQRHIDHLHAFNIF